MLYDAVGVKKMRDLGVRKMGQKVIMVEPERVIHKEYKELEFSIHPIAAVALLHTVMEYAKSANGSWLYFEQANGLRSSYYTCKELLQTKEVQEYIKDETQNERLVEFYSHDIEPGDIFVITGIDKEVEVYSED